MKTCFNCNNVYYLIPSGMKDCMLHCGPEPGKTYCDRWENTTYDPMERLTDEELTKWDTWTYKQRWLVANELAALKEENADLKNQITIFERNEANYVELLQESDNCAAGPWRPLEEEDKDGRDFLAKIQYRQDTFPEEVKVFSTVIWWEKEDSSWRSALEPYNDEEILEVAEIRR